MRRRFWNYGTRCFLLRRMVESASKPPSAWVEQWCLFKAGNAFAPEADVRHLRCSLFPICQLEGWQEKHRPYANTFFDKITADRPKVFASDGLLFLCYAILHILAHRIGLLHRADTQHSVRDAKALVDTEGLIFDHVSHALRDGCTVGAPAGRLFALVGQVIGSAVAVFDAGAAPKSTTFSDVFWIWSHGDRSSENGAAEEDLHNSFFPKSADRLDISVCFEHR